MSLPSSFAGTAHVLIVEDAPDDAGRLTRFVDQAVPGAAVCLVETLAEAFAALEEQSFDLLVCDLGLPNGDQSADPLPILREAIQRNRDQDALKDREQRLSAILGAVADAVIAIDDRGIIQTCNPATERMFGWSATELIGQSVARLMPEPYASAHDHYIQAFLETGIPKVIGKNRELVGLRRDGTSFPIDLTVTQARLERPRLFIGIVRDITERKAMEEELRRLATTDPLTGAANRRSFMEALAAETARAQRLGHPLSVVMLDIDHFKKLNDTWGHAAGDSALIQFVKTISARLRETDTLGRLGGEEFAILLPGTTAAQAVAVAEELRQRQEQAVLMFEGQAIRFTVSAGVASTQTTPARDLLTAADTALYASKQAGRNRVSSAVPTRPQ